MAVPSSVTERIKLLESARKHVDERKRSDQGLQARRLEVAAARAARRPLLLELSTQVFAWRDELVKSPEGQKFWGLIGAGARIHVFSDWFWDGLPIMIGNTLEAHTRVSLDGPHHHFLVEEWRKDGQDAPVPYHEVCRLTSPLQMVDQLHPRLIENLLTHVTGPEAWQSVTDELDRRIGRYVLSD